MSSSIKDKLKVLGPGIAVAATGVGAGDMIAAAVSGAKYGTAILWAAVIGALVKFALNEGIGRWQLATGQTLLEGWADKLGRWVSIVFAGYLLVWSFIVAGALIAACGLAANSVFPEISLATWGILHSIVAVVLVVYGRYSFFESVMKFFIGLMFVFIIAAAWLTRPDWLAMLPSLVIPTIPDGAGKFLLGVIGGVGGSVTLLNYSYWIREKNWEGTGYKSNINWDLGIAYGLTGLFGIAIMVIAAGVSPEVITGSKMVLAVGDRLGEIVGNTGKWIFLGGFWGAVFSSMLGVWQGVPYIFSDFMRLQKQEEAPEQGRKSPYYYGFLCYLAFPPMLLLLFDRPVWIVIIYSICGALFMPFLAITLLYMNNRREWVSSMKNAWYSNALLVLALLVFGYLCYAEVVRIFVDG